MMSLRLGFAPFLVALLGGCSLIVAPDSGLIGDDGGGGQGAQGGQGGATTTTTTTTGGEGGQGGEGGGGCTSPAMCPQPQNECEQATCVMGECGTGPVAQGTPITAQVGGDCQQAVCNGVGGTESVADNNDVPVDNNVCTDDVCTLGVPSNPNLNAGTSCGGVLVCDGAGQCVGCTAPSDCPGVDDECQSRTCNGSVCGFDFTTSGTPLTLGQASGDCQELQCDGSGGTMSADLNTDLPLDGLQCTDDLCTAGIPSNPARVAGTVCSEGGGLLCDGAGSCVECNLPSDCGSDSECVTFTCTLGACGSVNTAVGTPLTAGQTAGDCQELQCDGNGASTSVATNADVPIDAMECTDDVCTLGAPSNPPLTQGTVCTEGGGSFCNSTGACVECNSGTDCTSGVCTSNVCQAASCLDVTQNGLETDVDCGGGTCAPCSVGQMCAIDADCTTGNCVLSTCAAVVVLTQTPAEAAVAVSVSGTIELSFSGPVNPATLTSTTTLTSGPCTGNVQLSTDDFVSCLPMMAATPSMSAGNTVATLTPAPALSFGTGYKVRVTSAAQDAQGQAVTAFASSTAFTTDLGVLGSVPGGALVLSQVYGGGGNASAPFTHDFIEIHNRSTTAIDLTGMSVQYASSSGTTWQVTPLGSVMLAPGGYYLVQQASGGAIGVALPAPDATGSLAMSASNGKVALVADSTALTGACPAGVIDFLGYGSANCFETAASNAPSATLSVVRGSAGCTDGNNNGTDFATAAPTPRNTLSPVALCSPETANESGLSGELDFCNVQSPASLSLATGAPSGNVFGRVYDAGLTEPAGSDATIIAELGYGPRNSNPEHQAGWTFVSAAFNLQVGNDDEYSASFNAPAPGDYSYVFRFSKDGGLWWTYCDVNGAGSNGGLDFQVTQLPLMVVSP